MKGKILVLTSNGGNGLISGAQAIREGLESTNQDPPTEVKVVDFPKEISRFYNFSVGNSYNYLLQKSLRLCAIYVWIGYRFERIFSLLWGLYHQRFQTFFLLEKPDHLILCSPWIIQPIMAYFKRHPTQAPKSITVVVLDLAPPLPPGWMHQNVDKYLVPSWETFCALVKEGIPARKIQITELPLRQQFISSDKYIESATTANTPHVVISAGREGNQDILQAAEKILAEKSLPYRLTLICGENKRYKERLEKLVVTRGHNNCQIIGYVAELAPILKTVDLLVTKAGALTISEALRLKTPLLIYTYPTIMPQEKGNLKFLQNRGLLNEAKNSRELRHKLGELGLNKKFSAPHRAHQIEIYDSIKDIPKESWNNLTAFDTEHSHAFYQILEESLTDYLRLKYIVVYEQKKAVAAVPVSLISGLPIAAPNIHPITYYGARLFLKLFPCFAKWSVAMVGSIFSETNRFFFPVNIAQENKKYCAKLIVKTIEALAQSQKINFIFFKDFSPKFSNLLRSFGFHVSSGLPRNIIPVEGHSFETHLERLHASWRRNIRRNIRQSTLDAAVNIKPLPAKTILPPELGGLYLNVWRRAALKFDLLNQTFFQACNDRLTPQIQHLICEVDGQIIGFLMYLVAGDRLIIKRVGISYKNPQTYAYFLLFYRAIEIGMAQNIKYVDLGPTAYYTKLRWGSVLKNSYNYFKHRNKFIDFFYLQAYRFILSPYRVGRIRKKFAAGKPFHY